MEVVEKVKYWSKFWLPVTIWLVIIFAFSSQPTSAVSEIDWRDFIFKKTIHFFEFGILFILFFRALKNSIKLAQVAFWAFVFTVLYAVSDEYHQTLVSGRTGTVRDIVIDSTGAFLFWLVIWKYLPKAPAKLKSWAKSWQLI